MASLTVHDAKGKKVGTYSIEPTDLAPRINKQLLHDVVVMYQANQRQGSFRSRTRAEVSGSTKKLYRQKGTGNARAGSRRSGIRRGGGHIFAKRPRDFSYRLPRKAVQLATRMAIAAKIRAGQVVVIDKLAFDEPKTKRMAEIIEALDCDGGTLLVSTATHDTNVYMSARNIGHVSVSPASDLNALAVLEAERLLVTPDALDVIKQRAASAKGSADKEPSA